MAITYPLTLPSTNFRRVEFAMRSSVGVTESPFTHRSQKVDWGGDRWLARIVLPPLKTADAREWQGFLAALRGKFGTFLLGDPFNSAPRGSTPGAPVINETTPLGFTLITDGWTASQNGILLRGDMFQVEAGASSRMYIVTEDANSNVSGQSTLSIWPRWRGKLADYDGIALNFAAPKAVFRLRENLREYSISDLVTYGIAFEAEEDLPA